VCFSPEYHCDNQRGIPTDPCIAAIDVCFGRQEETWAFAANCWAATQSIRRRGSGSRAAQFSMQSFKPKARNDHGDSDPTYGNGWAILKTRNQITGAEFIHRGDESTFTAQSG
jgi:hypothetical protein